MLEFNITMGVVKILSTDDTHYFICEGREKGREWAASLQQQSDEARLRSLHREQVTTLLSSFELFECSY